MGLPGGRVIVSTWRITWIIRSRRGRGWIFCWLSWGPCSVLVSTFCGKTSKKARIKGYGYNDFGSKDGESNAKACKESVLLFLLRPGNVLPLLVRVPVTSKPRFLKYTARLAGNLVPVNSVVTKITLEKATSKAGKPYALFNFEAVSILSPQEAERAKTYARQLMDSVNAAELMPDLAEAS